MKQKGSLYLVPSGLGSSEWSMWLPHGVVQRIHTLRFFMAERAKTARHFLKSVDYPHALQDTVVSEYDKHTEQWDLKFLTNTLLDGNDVGLLSEAGLPAVADPGSGLVHHAHQQGFEVMPLVGPSSLMLALMASGFNGQQFRFHGYLPRQEPELGAKLRQMEKDAQWETQIFIEVPYRNKKMIEALVSNLSAHTRLSVGIDLTLPTAKTITKQLGQWRPDHIADKHPAVFLLYAGR